MRSSLVWFRSDLRCADNKALHFATHDNYDRCLAVFFICEEQWRKHHHGNRKVDLILSHVSLLQEELIKLNIHLHVIKSRYFRDVPKQLADFCQQHNIEQVFANYEYPINEINRDQACVNTLSSLGIECQFFHDFIVHATGSVKTQQGEYFKVFTPFKRKWISKSSPSDFASFNPNKMPETNEKVDAFNYTTAEDLIPIGESAALNHLDQFCDTNILRYDSNRDFPALDQTSRLSSYLAIGAISIRACYRKAMEQNEGHLDGPNPGSNTWISELIWREFYQHILRGFPFIVKGHSFQKHTESIVWHQNEIHLQAWKDGNTGIPIVDAAMRQLNQTGWMHNRLRMVVAMFLTKNLFIDWREGEKYFMELLLDGEFGANNGGWQWAASTGTDAAPYFRVFNPISQSKKFDPDGNFIRQYVPEIAHLPSSHIHEPWKSDSSLGSYPSKPIVDLKSTRAYAIEKFKELAR